MSKFIFTRILSSCCSIDITVDRISIICGVLNIILYNVGKSDKTVTGTIVSYFFISLLSTRVVHIIDIIV